MADLANEIHLYRNTFVGLVRVRGTDGEDGPFHFARNVSVSTDTGPDRIRTHRERATVRVGTDCELVHRGCFRGVHGRGIHSPAHFARFHALTALLPYCLH